MTSKFIPHLMCIGTPAGNDNSCLETSCTFKGISLKEKNLLLRDLILSLIRSFNLEEIHFTGKETKKPQKLFRFVNLATITWDVPIPSERASSFLSEKLLMQREKISSKQDLSPSCKCLQRGIATAEFLNQSIISVSFMFTLWIW